MATKSKDIEESLRVSEEQARQAISIAQEALDRIDEVRRIRSIRSQFK